MQDREGEDSGAVAAEEGSADHVSDRWLLLDGIIVRCQEPTTVSHAHIAASPLMDGSPRTIHGALEVFRCRLHFAIALDQR